MNLIDTHAHISHFKESEQEAVIERAMKAGINKFVNVACNLKELESCLEIAKSHDFIWTTAGMHPTDLADDMEESLALIRQYAAEPKVVAIGEIGLDYYHDKFPHDVQEDFFAAQLNIAREFGLPAVIHLRSSKNPGENEEVFYDAINILEREEFSNAVAHCFSGNMIEAEKLLDMGLMMSFTGIITYERNEELREVIKMIPLDRIMLETDSPYLTIESNKGNPGESKDILEIAKCVAEVKGVPLEEVARITTENAQRFFRI